MTQEPTVMQAKRYGVHTCHCTTPLSDVARLMADEDISSLVVVDKDGYLEGVISRMDLIRAKEASPNWMGQTAGDCMSKDVVTVCPDEPLSKVASLLLEKHIHRVVAVPPGEGKKRPLAVISSADLVYHMAKDSRQKRRLYDFDANFKFE
jgi:CBS domain-containing protein